MIETIFRVIIIILVISIVLAVASTIGITFGYPIEYFSVLLSFLHIVCYLVPLGKLWPILLAVVSISIFKIGVSILKTIWNIFPLSG